MNAFILFGLPALASCTSTTAEAISYNDYQDGKPRNSYEKQREEYRQHNYDSYRNGPLQETLEQERREERRREEYRREQRRESYGQYGGDRCRSLYGCSLVLTFLRRWCRRPGSNRYELFEFEGF